VSGQTIETRLMNKAVHYLGRYSASQHRLREVLGRFARRKLADMPEADVLAGIDTVVATCLRLCYVDDEMFAASQARSQRRQGRSSLAIKQRLRLHALDDAEINTAIDAADGDSVNAELAAAITFARRRRLGPFFTGTGDDRTRQKHMASLARAGFAINLCKTIIDAADIETLEAMEQDALRDLDDDR
jgi:regulatory protein